MDALRAHLPEIAVAAALAAVLLLRQIALGLGLLLARLRGR
jgi:hypothetical protein